MFSNLKLGDKKIVQLSVKKEDTALNYGSGQLENLFASPKLVALTIEAASKLIDSSLPDGFISVGKSFNIEHIAPTTLGQTITLEVEIIALSEPKVTISMNAYDEIGLIGKGEHVRYIVNKISLLEKAYERSDFPNNIPID
jgi:predicted thioesterase